MREYKHLENIQDANYKQTNTISKETDRDKTYVTAYCKVCTKSMSRLNHEFRESAGLTCSHSTFI